MATKKVGDFYMDWHPNGAIFYETPARTDFNAARDHAIALMKIHDEKTGGSRRRAPEAQEALKRSSLILTVTAWESFVEDTVECRLHQKLNAASGIGDLQSVFNLVAGEWLDPEKSGKRHGPELAKWTGEEWKIRIKESLDAALEKFHTPNTENTNKLFKRYLGVQIQDKWCWNAMRAADAQKKLDAFIRLRGRVAHLGNTFHPMSPKLTDVRRAKVIDGLNFFYRLVCATEAAVGTEQHRCLFETRKSRNRNSV